ncbi:MAG: hypothetical protein NTV70_02830 [Acidobacteria bacterium]|nr:hypothetical protein [Acidobacteriota bacterium]
MGLEATCIARHAGREAEGKLLLETGELLFRGPFRLKLPLDGAKVTVERGDLVVDSAEGEARFALGAEATKWHLKIRYPKPRSGKLGIKAGLRVAILNLDDELLPLEIAEAGAELLAKPKQCDLIFLGVHEAPDLAALARVEAQMVRSGAVWVVYPKGVKHITEAMVRQAMLDAALVDVKVCAFSERLTALKAVIPVARR